MNPQVQSLANKMRIQHQAGEKFVLMLGAGASMSSGVPSTPQLMEELLAKFGAEITGNAALEDKFDQLWARTNDRDRRMYLQPYLDRQPSSGYARLAALVAEGYFEVALTFNFDDLVEKALKGAGFSDYKRVIRGETIDAEMQKLIDMREPAFKLVKLHGSLTSSDHFLFDASEMNQYPDPIHKLVNGLTARNILVCGYGFNDLCVARAFALTGDSIVWVNPSRAPKQLRGLLKDRRSEDLGIELGFDDFFEELHHELLVARPLSVAAEPAVRLPNPFKFLESYEESDAEYFQGRSKEVTAFTTTLDKLPAPRIVVVAGPAKAGKTSLVRAGIIPSLDSTKYEPVYVRCQPDLEKSLPRDLWPNDSAARDLSMPDALQRLVDEAPGRRVVVFLDQFDRATSRYDAGKKEDLAACAAFLEQRVIGVAADLTLVLVVGDELVPTLFQTSGDLNVSCRIVQCRAFPRDDVAEIMQSLAQRGGLAFDQRILDDMLKSYVQAQASALDQRFTLAHIQAVFHILAATRTVDYDSYRRAFDNNLMALHQAINVCDIISFVEDFPWTDAAWFRNMIRVPLNQSKERIADFIKSHYEELRPTAPPPRGRAALDARAAVVRP